MHARPLRVICCCAVKKTLLDALKTEETQHIRRQICHTIAELAATACDPGLGGWPGLIETIQWGSQQGPPQVQALTLLLLQRVAEYVGKVMFTLLRLSPLFRLNTGTRPGARSLLAFLSLAELCHPILGCDSNHFKASAARRQAPFGPRGCPASLHIRHFSHAKRRNEGELHSRCAILDEGGCGCCAATMIGAAVTIHTTGTGLARRHFRE